MLRIVMTMLFLAPALMLQADQPAQAEPAKATSQCCLDAKCPVAAVDYCACGNCKEGCNCCETDVCKCEGCSCVGCTSKDGKSNLHAALVDVSLLLKADCCQSGKCAIATTKCGCDACEEGCKCCSDEKCECKTCQCEKCKDPAVGAHALASASCACGSCKAGCGCCTSGKECKCDGCTCSGCTTGNKMHMILVSKTADACCKTGGACAHDHHANKCECGASKSEALPETPVLND